MHRALRNSLNKLPLDFRVLFRHFLLQLVDLDALSIEASMPRLLGQFAGILILISILQTVGFLYAAGLPGMSPMALVSLAMKIEQSLLSGTMLIAGLIAVATWNNIFPDRRDVMILGPLPLPPGKILAAKTAAAGYLLAIGVVGLNFGMGLALPLVAGHGWRFFRVFPAYWFATASAALFVYGGVVAIQGLMAALLPQRWFLRLSSALQLMAFALFLSVWLFQPSFASPAALIATDPHGLLTRWPMLWFFGLFGHLSGVFPSLPSVLARRAGCGISLVIAGATTSLLLCYRRTMKKTVEEPDLIPGRSRRIWPMRFGDSLHTAVVQFSIRSLVRSRHHRMVYAFFLAITAGISVSTLQELLTRHLRAALSVDFLMSTLLMLCLAIFGLRSIFSLPVSLKANWVLQVTQLRPAEQYVSATRRAMLVIATIPVFLTSAALTLCHRPWRADAESLLLLVLIATLLTDLSLIGISKIPFACSYLPGKSNVQYAFWGLIGAFVPFALTFSRYELEILHRPFAYALLVAETALVAVVVWALNRRKARAAVLYYEELEPEVITTLGIGSWQPQKEHAP